MADPSVKESNAAVLRKSPVGISGLDEITGGGIPRGRVSLVCGGPGTGKTLLALRFLVHGVGERGEPGVFVSFEEAAGELAENTASLGWDVSGLAESGQLRVEHVRADRGELTEAGEYDLEALFVRLGHALDSVGAKRVTLDSVEALFGALGDEALLRNELRRLFGWLKDRGVTTILTAERGDGGLTRHGLEEYVSDCVILLDHRIRDQASTRRLRIVKYRGSSHGSDEYPFMIDADGFSVFPRLRSLGFAHVASSERVPTGVDRLDEMVGGGYFRGSSVLVSGGPGTGKTSLAAALARDACRRGERCLYFALEESQSQLVRNMGSIGIELEPLVREGALAVSAGRASESRLEAHLAEVHKQVLAFEPTTVIVDPITNFSGQRLEVARMLTRMIDLLKARGITALLTTLLHEGETSAVGVTSLADTWLHLTNVERLGERNRAITVIKSRGSAQSNQQREFVLRDDGIDVLDAYAGEGGLLLGRARAEAEAAERAARREREAALAAARRRAEAHHAAMRAQVATLEAQMAAELADAEAEIGEREEREAQLTEDERVREDARASGSRLDGPPG